MNQIKRPAALSDTPDDSQSGQTIPLVQQVNALNQQNIQVRRPSDLTICSQKAVESLSSTTQINQKLSSKPPETPQLHFINEEPSQKEQSLQFRSVHDSVKKSVLSNHQEPLFEHEDPSQSDEKKELLHFQSVNWDRLHTAGTQKQNAFTQIPHKIINDKSEGTLRKSASSGAKQGVCFVLYGSISIFYIVALSQILLHVEGRNFELIYSVPFQIIMMLVSISTCLVQYLSGIKFRRQAYLCVIQIVPFLSSLADRNQQAMDVQLIHLLSLFTLYDLSKHLKFLFLASQLYIAYLFLASLVQFHFVQMIAKYFALRTLGLDDEPEILGWNSFTILDILHYDDTSSLTVYFIKLLLISYLLFFASEIFVEMHDLKKIDSIMIKQMIQISKALASLKMERRLKYLKEQQQLLTGLAGMHTLQSTNIPDESHTDIMEQLYIKHLNALPIFEDLSLDLKRKILRISREHIYQPNQTIRNTESLFFLIDGTVEIIQENDQQGFTIKSLTEPQILNQPAFFIGELNKYCIRCKTYAKLIEIPKSSFINELQKRPQDLQRYRMNLDLVLYSKVYNLVRLECFICGQNHSIDSCKFIHYKPSRQFLIDYIQRDRQMNRIPRQRKTRERYHSIKQQHNLEFVILNYRHLQQMSSDTSHRHNRKPLTITSIAQHHEDELQEHLHMQVQNLSPVQQVIQPLSSMSSYPIQQRESTLKNEEVRSKSRLVFTEGQQNYQKYVDSFVLHQKRYREKRQSFAQSYEQIEQPSYQKFATVQDRRNSVIHSDPHQEDKSRMAIQSSKFTGETSKQFLQSPLEMPLYANDSFDSSHQFSDYFPQFNIDQALQSYRMFQVQNQ